MTTLDKVFGKTTDGSAILEGTAKPTGGMDEFTFRFHAPKDAGEVAAMLKADPKRVLDLISDALKTDARSAAWGEARKLAGITSTVEVKLKATGAVLKVSAKTAEDLRKAGAIA